MAIDLVVNGQTVRGLSDATGCLADRIRTADTARAAAKGASPETKKELLGFAARVEEQAFGVCGDQFYEVYGPHYE